MNYINHEVRDCGVRSLWCVGVVPLPIIQNTYVADAVSYMMDIQ